MKGRLILIVVILALIAGAGFGVWFFFGKKGSPLISPSEANHLNAASQNGPGQPNQSVGADDRAQRYVPTPQEPSHPLNVPTELLASSTDLSDPVLKAAFNYQPYQGTSAISATVSASTSTPAASASVQTPTGYNGAADTDGDGLTNDQELKLGTNPKNADTDGDGLTDGEEALTYHTDPLKADTDGDGYSDGTEVKTGYNPNGPGKLKK
jgi:hypothetical protein